MKDLDLTDPYIAQRHNNALDLRLEHASGTQYKVPKEWTGGVSLYVDLEKSGKTQLRIMTEVAKQLALKAAIYFSTIQEEEYEDKDIPVYEFENDTEYIHLIEHHGNEITPPFEK